MCKPLSFVLLLIVITACGTSSPGSTTSSAFTPIPSITIDTTAGKITVKRTQLSDQWPPDCSIFAGPSDKNRCMVTATEGHKIFAIFYDGAEVDQALTKTSYLTEDDKTEKIEPSLWGSTGQNSFFGFTVSNTAKRFLLNWPNNPAIEIPVNLVGSSIAATFTLPPDWRMADAGQLTEGSGHYFFGKDNAVIVSARNQRPPQLQPGQAVAEMIIYSIPAPLGIDRDKTKPTEILRVLTSLDKTAQKTTFGEIKTIQLGSVNVAIAEGENGSSEVIYYGFFMGDHAVALIGMVAKGEKETNRAVFENIVSTAKLN